MSHTGQTAEASDPAAAGTGQGGHAVKTANKLPDDSDQIDKFSGLELLIRQLDAEVSFKPQIFCQELIFNIFGVLVSPLMAFLVGYNGIMHRWFFCNCARVKKEDAVFLHTPVIPWLPCCCVMRAGNTSSVHQFVHLAIIMTLNTSYMMFKMNNWPVAVTVTEVVITNVLVVLRAATVAAKYSFFSAAEYAQTTKAPVDGWNDQRKQSKLVLGGWIAPTDSLLYLELERAAARNAPGLDTMTIVYPSDTARLTALSEMAESIPTFLQNESAIMHPRCVEFLKAFEQGEDVEPLLRADAMRLGDRLAYERRSKSRASVAGVTRLGVPRALSSRGSPERLLMRQFTPSSPTVEGIVRHDGIHPGEDSPVHAVGGSLLPHGGSVVAQPPQGQSHPASAGTAANQHVGSASGVVGVSESSDEAVRFGGAGDPTLPQASGAATHAELQSDSDSRFRGGRAPKARRMSMASEMAVRTARGLAGASALGSQSFRLGRATSRGRPPTGWANMPPVRHTVMHAQQHTRLHLQQQAYPDSTRQGSHAADLGTHIIDNTGAPPSISHGIGPEGAFGPVPVLAGGSWPFQQPEEDVAPTPAERLLSTAVLGEATTDADAAVRNALAGVIAPQLAHGSSGAPPSPEPALSQPAESGAIHSAAPRSRAADSGHLPPAASRLGLPPPSTRQQSLEERTAFATAETSFPADDQAMLYDCSGMATLPAKLAAWHVIRTSHGNFNVAGAAFGGTRLVGLCFALIPVLVRAYLGGSVMKILNVWSPLEIMVQVLLIWASYTNSRVTIAFCALGAIDLWRRFAAQVTLHRLLDVKSPLTLEMHDALVRSAGGTFLKAMGLQTAEDELMGSIFSDGHGVQPAADAKQAPLVGVIAGSSHVPGIPVAMRSAHDKGLAPAQRKVNQHKKEHSTPLDEAETLLRRRGGRHGAADGKLRPRSRIGSAASDAADARTSIQAWRAAWDKASKRYLGTPQRGPVKAHSQFRPPKPASPALDEPALPSNDVSGLPDHEASRVFAAHVKADAMRMKHPRLASVIPEIATSSTSTPVESAGKPVPDCDEDDTVRRLIVSQATWLGPQQAERLVDKRVQHLRVPVFYPQNLLSWLHLRNTASDFGRTYAMRIQLYTLYFMVLVCVIVVAQLVLFFNIADTPANEAAILLTLGTFTEVVFAIVVLVQMTTAARTNRSISFQRRRFNRIEAMTQDLLCSYSEPLATSTELRLKKCRKVLSLLAKSLDSEGDLNPVRVMFLPADFRLVASFLSIAGSGALAALAQLRNVSWGG